MSLRKLVEDYVKTRLAYDIAHDLSSKCDRAFKMAKKRLTEGMIIESATHDPPDHPLKFFTREQFTIKCNKDNEEDVKEWLHGHYGDLEEFTVPKVNKTAVTDRFEADIKAEVLDQFEVPDFFSLNTDTDISCNGWREYSVALRNE